MYKQSGQIISVEVVFIGHHYIVKLHATLNSWFR